MAKNDMAKLMERHLEKAVLGFCVLLLAFAAVHWSISSPREFTPASGGAAMEPSQVDKYLAARAAALADKTRRNEVPEAILALKGKQTLPEWDKKIQEDRQFKVNALAQPALGDPQVAKVQPAGAPPPVGVPLSDFTKLVPAPAPPRIVSGVILPQADKAADLCVNGGVGAYPFRKLMAAWGTIETTVAMAPLRVDVEVEETTSEGKVAVTPVEPLIRTAPAPVAKGKADAKEKEKVTVPSLPAIPEYTGKNQSAVYGAINEINSERRQRQIVTPDLPAIWEASIAAWAPGEMFLKPVLPEKLWPAMPTKPTGPVIKPAPGGGTPRATPPVRPVTPATPVRPAVRPAGTPGRTTPPTTVKPPAAPVRLPVTPAGDDPRTALAGRVPPPERSVDLAGRVPPPERSVDLGDAGRTSGPAETVVSVIPSRRGPDNHGVEEISLWWLHPNVKPGCTYRYRLKVTFISPLLGRPLLAKNPEEAKIKTVESPWSDWSEAVTVQRPIRFFLTNKVTEGQVRVAAFAHAMGQWVRRDYTVSQGDPIGRMEPLVNVWNPIADKKQDVPVDFTTGAVALDFEEAAVVLAGGRAQSTVEMIYLDDDGHVKAATSVAADRTSAAGKDYDALDQLSKQEPKRSGTGAGKIP